MKNDFSGNFGDIDNYNSISLNKYTVKELRKEYRKLRKEAKERLKELSESEFSDSKLLENKEFLLENPSNKNLEKSVAFLDNFSTRIVSIGTFIHADFF